MGAGSSSRRCLLVSRPLGTQRSADWCAIGNCHPVPSLLDNLPITEHWALCIIPDGEHDYADPECRQMFLEADYFDLGVGSSQQYSFLLLSTSRSRSFDDVHYQTRWSSAQVRSITTIEDIGVTTRGNGWIAGRALEMCSGWGQYLPILWNCQHFAVLLTQMAVDTDMSARVTSYLFEKRSAAVQNVRGARNIGLAAIAASGSFVPVVGPLVALGSAATAGVYQYTDALKDNAITAKLWGFVDRYDELQKMFYYLPYLS